MRPTGRDNARSCTHAGPRPRHGSDPRREEHSHSMAGRPGHGDGAAGSMPIAANRLTRSSASKSRGTLAPSDPLIFLAAVGIAAAHFEAYRYEGCSLVSACSRRAAQGRLDQSISHSGLCPRGAEGRGETEPLHTHFGVSIAHHIPNSDRLASQRQLSRQRVQRP
jgi:hypothetical protein